MEFYSVILLTILSASSVSIPNGMEFYPIPLPINPSPNGFNSQRDGILLKKTNNERKIKTVSIPNGMEFYADLGHFFASLLVSIPNGMEFYAPRLIKPLASFFVSIPNGMEFYPRLHKLRLLQKGFNSQRDGILPSYIYSAYSYEAFQFPTGWNSTVFMKGMIEQHVCFNSQRDGILQ